jgi:hypothetical protein
VERWSPPDGPEPALESPEPAPESPEPSPAG